MCGFVCCWLFLFKQKTAYEMRISDWSSDVCSSDLNTSSSCDGRLVDRRSDAGVPPIDGIGGAGNEARFARDKEAYCRGDLLGLSEAVHQIGRASCRESVCQYV